MTIEANLIEGFKLGFGLGFLLGAVCAFAMAAWFFAGGRK